MNRLISALILAIGLCAAAYIYGSFSCRDYGPHTRFDLIRVNKTLIYKIDRSTGETWAISAVNISGWKFYEKKVE